MSTRFYNGDLVVDASHSNERGELVLLPNDIYNGYSSLSDDSDDLQRHTSVSERAYRQYLNTNDPPSGTGIVEWPGSTQLISLAHLQLVLRPLEMGAIVRHHPSASMSGTVIHAHSTFTLQGLCEYDLDDDTRLLSAHTTAQDARRPFVTHYRPDPLRAVPGAELKTANKFDRPGTVIIYKDWVGTIVHRMFMVVIRLSNNTVVRLAPWTLEHFNTNIDESGFQIGDIVETTQEDLSKAHWVRGSYDPDILPQGTVVTTKSLRATLKWLHRRPGATSSPEPDIELDGKQLRSDDVVIYHPWKMPTAHNKDSDDTRVSYPHDEIEDYSRVRFIDSNKAAKKYDGTDGKSRLSLYARSDTLDFDMNVMSVLDSRSQVTVLWQDASISQHDSTALVPDEITDDKHDAWPGEVAHSIDLEDVPGLPNVLTPKKVGIIQSVDTKERLAKIRWCPNAKVHYASLLDQAYGESLKQLVQGTIGLTSEEVEEVSLYDIEAPASLNVSRGDLVLVNEPDKCGLRDVKGINWLGTIVEDRLDGALRVRLSSAKPVQDVILLREQVTVAIRFADGVETALDESSSSGSDDDISDDSFEPDRDSLASGFMEHPLMYEPTYKDEDGYFMDIEEAEDAEWVSTDGDDDSVEKASVGSLDGKPLADADPTTTSDDGSVDEELSIDQASTTEIPARPPPYLLHDSAVPNDHHFRHSPAPTNSTRMKRIQKEHRIFQKPGALPEGVYVRSWEAQLDLWRVMIVGPQETPYADVPFIIDFYLPTDYPYSPPQAFFHSWAGEGGLGGAGPVNPNLYEDGKICLSLLGTWHGSRRENWNPSGSTLLQVVVSILGLVLVKEPYYNEAGYEEQIGTEEAKRPSILYSERAMLRSLNFAISAIAALKTQRSLAGMNAVTDVLHWLYLESDGGLLLEKLRQRVELILSNSAISGVEADGLTVMSRGACISMARVLARLDQLRSGS